MTLLEAITAGISIDDPWPDYREPTVYVSGINKIAALKKFYVLEGSDDSGCKHNWKKYIGFTQVYEYCTICDLKRS